VSLPACLALLAALVPAATRGQGIPRGPEFQVNSFTPSDGQDWPEGIAFGADGRFVIVWSSAASPADDTEATSIQARRFDASGAPLGPQFQVNSLTTGFQSSPRVVTLEDDGFLVVWSSQASGGSDADESIQARRYDADGDAVGSEFQVNTYTTGMQSFPDSGVDDLGRVAIVWGSNGSPGTDQDGASVLGRLFDADLSPVGGDFQVNAVGTGDQLTPTVARRASGGFVVAWSSQNASDNYGIRARRFDAAGSPLGSDFLVGSNGYPVASWPQVAADESKFVVTWHDYGQSAGTDDSYFSIQARAFDGSGTPLGPDFQVNQTTPGYQWMSSVAMVPDGGFVVAWTSDGSAGSDSSYDSIQAREYDGAGVARGDEFQVNTYTTLSQRYPVVRSHGDGFVVAWTSLGSFGDDTSDWSAQARRYAIPLFADGFESGDTSAWSATAP
jgi:hypothetical protein